VPGTYLIGEPVVTIAAFAQQLHVITSKQRPRKLTIHGSDGAEYMFLLKGHEDLRQVRGMCCCCCCCCCIRMLQLCLQHGLGVQQNSSGLCN
jgi:hypothetical protein